MRRRELIAGLGSTLVLGVGTANAQRTARMRRIGILLYSRQEHALIAPFIQGLEALGHVDGKTIAIDYHDAEGKAERLAVAASELVSLAPDVIFSNGGDPAPFIKRATSTIPIVVVVSSDPV